MGKQYVVLGIDGEGDVIAYTSCGLDPEPGMTVPEQLARDMVADFDTPTRVIQIIEVDVPSVKAQKLDISKIPTMKLKPKF